MRWAGNIACMGEIRNPYKILVGIANERNHLEDLGVDGKTTVKHIFMKEGMRIGPRFIWWALVKTIMNLRDFFD
jgi:hypothetical protein